MVSGGMVALPERPMRTAFRFIKNIESDGKCNAA